MSILFTNQSLPLPFYFIITVVQIVYTWNLVICKLNIYLIDLYQYGNDHIWSDCDIHEPLTGRFRVELHRVIASEEALQLYTGYILATPEIGLRLSNNPDLYHRSVYGNKHSYATLQYQGHYTTN